MLVRSALGRLAITLPFFGTAMVVLALMGNPALSPPPVTDSSLILVVTNEVLTPAFEDLESWNRSQGGRSELLILAPGAGSEQQFVQELGALCRERGITGILLGGNHHQVPIMSSAARFPGPEPESVPHVVPIPTPRVSPIPPDLALGRVPVGNLDEAWAFVQACRESGNTLDRLFAKTMTEDMAVAIPVDEISAD